ncbi:MAG TPA: hypothetical protein VGD29_22045 [Actinoplanes sp.]
MKLVHVVGMTALLALSACSSSPSPAPSKPRVYRATGDLCGRVDPNALAAVLGPLKSRRTAPGVGGTSVATRSCTLQFGTSVPIPVEVSIQLATNGASVAPYYQGLRGVEEKQTQLSTVSGLGQDAYTYEDATGPHLVAYDNNLYLSYAVVMGGLPQSSVPSGVVGAEVASAHATMDKLIQ